MRVVAPFCWGVAFAICSTFAIAAEEDYQAIRRLNAQIEASKLRLGSLRYVLETDYQNFARQDPRFSPRVTSVETVLLKGNLRRAAVKRTSYDEANIPQPMQEFRTVINDRYSVGWVVGTSNAQQYVHSSASAPATVQEASVIGGWKGNDILKYGFGAATTDLDSLLNNTLPDQWSLKEIPSADGSSLFQLTLNRNGKSKVLYQIDPNKGFLVTSMQTYTGDGSLYFDLAVTVRQVQGDFWFPVEVHERRFEKGQCTHDLRMKLKEIHCNVEIEDSEFTVDQMGFIEGTACISQAPDGTLTAYRWLSNKLIPNDVNLMLRLAAADEDKRVHNLDVLKPISEEHPAIPPAVDLERANSNVPTALHSIRGGGFYPPYLRVGVAIVSSVAVLLAGLIAWFKLRRGANPC